MDLQEQANIAEAVLRLSDIVEGNPKALSLLYTLSFNVFKLLEEHRLRKLYPTDREESLVDKYFGTGEVMGSPTDGSIDWPLLIELLEHMNEETAESKAYLEERAPLLVEAIKRIRANVSQGESK